MKFRERIIKLAVSWYEKTVITGYMILFVGLLLGKFQPAVLVFTAICIGSIFALAVIFLLKHT